MKNRLIGVTGVTGVGKDHLISAANYDGRARIINLGTVVGEKLKMNRDHMMSIAEPQEMHSAQLAAYIEVVQSQPAIVSCHTVRDQGDGLQYFPEMEKIFNPLSYIYVHAPGELVVERVRKRNLSSERKSAVLPPAQIDDEQAIKLELMHELTDLLGCELHLIENVDDAFCENIALIQRELGRLSVIEEKM